MLTFFRRIRKGLLDGGRTSKYLLYALGEIALVVIGILIALQINNWNTEHLERETLISDLKNAQTYILAEIKEEETTSQNLIAYGDTTQNALRIIEEVSSPSLLENKYLAGARRHLLKTGLRSGDVSILHNLSISISKSKRESRHELLTALSQLIDVIEQANFLEDTFFVELLAMQRSVNHAVGSKYYEFEQMKTDDDLQFLFRRSSWFKNVSGNFGERIIEHYRVVYQQLENLLNELE